MSDNYINENYRTAKQRGVVAPKFFAHAALKTSRFEEMTQWFTTVLNAEIVFKSDLACFMTYDEDHHRIALLNIPGLSDPEVHSSGVDHLSFTYESIEDLIATYERLKGEAIVPFWTILHGPTLSMYYKTPDNGNVELQIDCFESAEACMEWFKSGPYDENPIGIKVDIEELFERYRNGEPLQSLLKRRRLRDGESFMEHVVM